MVQGVAAPVAAFVDDDSGVYGVIPEAGTPPPSWVEDAAEAPIQLSQAALRPEEPIDVFRLLCRRYGIGPDGREIDTGDVKHAADKTLLAMLRVEDDSLERAVDGYNRDPSRSGPELDVSTLGLRDVATLGLHYQPDAATRRVIQLAEVAYSKAQGALMEAAQAAHAGHPADAALGFEKFKLAQVEFGELHINHGQQRSDAHRSDVERLAFWRAVSFHTAAALGSIATAYITATTFGTATALAAASQSTTAATPWLSAAWAALNGTAVGGVIQGGIQALQTAASDEPKHSFELADFVGLLNHGTRQAAQVSVAFALPSAEIAQVSALALRSTGTLARLAQTGMNTLRGQVAVGAGVSLSSSLVNHVSEHVLGGSSKELSLADTALDVSWGTLSHVVGARLGGVQFGTVGRFGVEQVRGAASHAADAAINTAQALGEASMSPASTSEKVLSIVNSIASNLAISHGAQSGQRNLLTHAAELSSLNSSRLKNAEEIVNKLTAIQERDRTPDQRNILRLVEQFSTPEGAAMLQPKQAGHVAGDVTTLSPGLVMALVLACGADATASVDRNEAPNIDHLAMVLTGVLRDKSELAGRALTQEEFELSVLETVPTDVRFKNVDIEVMRHEEVAPLLDASKTRQVGETVGEFWDHALATNREFFEKRPFMAGVLVHGIPSFDYIRGIVVTAGHDDAMARHIYACVLGHHVAGFIANGFSKAGVRVDFDALRQQGALTRRDAQDLERLYDAAIAFAGQSRDGADAAVRVHQGSLPLLAGPGVAMSRQEYAERAQVLRSALDRLRAPIRQQALNDDWCQFLPGAMRKWLGTAGGFIGPSGTMADAVQWINGEPVQGYFEHQIALGHESRFKDNTMAAMERLGLVYVESDFQGDGLGGHWRPVVGDDGAAYGRFGEHLRQNAMLQSMYETATGRANGAPDIVEWFRGLEFDIDLADAVVTSPMP